MKTLSTIAAALLISLCALTASASAKTPPPVTLDITAVCVVGGIMPSDYHATATLTSATVPVVNLVSKNKGLLATNITLTPGQPTTVSYFGPVDVKTDVVTAVTPGGAEVGSFQVHTPCVKAPQGQA